MIYSVVGASLRDENVHIRFFGAFDSLEAAEAGMNMHLLSCNKCWICKSELNKCAPDDDEFIGKLSCSAIEYSGGNDTDGEKDTDGGKELGHEHHEFIQSILRRKKEP